MNNQNLTQKDIIVIFGPTAVGKNEFAINYAKKHNGVIINADSAQVYKECPTLTNIPNNINDIDHFLYGFLNITDNFSVGDWLHLVKQTINIAFDNNKLPIVVGGSGMYISSLLDGISPIPSNELNKQKAIQTYQDLGHTLFFQLMEEIDPDFTKNFQDQQRLIRAYEVYLTTNLKLSELQKEPKIKIVNGNFKKLYLYRDRNKLYNNINVRTLDMMQNGAPKEVQDILYNMEDPKQYLKKILGANDILSYLNNKQTFEDTVSIIQKKTRNYAKRQITWFKNQIIDKTTIVID